MTRTERFMGGTTAFLILATTTFLLATAATFAQASGSLPGRTLATASLTIGQQGPQGGQQQDGRRPRRPPLPVAAATIPVEVMTDYLKLTNEQASKVQTITQDVREQMRPQRPQPGEGNANGGRPTPPSESEREAQRKKVEAAIKTASDSITALLTDEQKYKLTVLLKAFDALQASRIPPQALRELKLTEEQLTRLSALGKTATRDSVTALLTEEQKSALNAVRPGGRGGQGGPDGPGGPGGFGGPGGPGDGPPPPDGGPGGPPPGEGGPF